MPIVLKQTYQAIFAEDNAFGLTDVQADAGDVIFFTVQYRNAAAFNISVPPTWNGQSFVSEAPRADALNWSQTWSVTASSTATANVLCPTDGDYFTGLSLARVYSGVASHAPVVQQVNTGTYVDPSLVSDTLLAGDWVDEVLNASGFSEGYGQVPGVTWTEANGQTRQATVSTGAATVGSLIFSTKTGVGAQTCGYTPTGGTPAYAHSLIRLVAASGTPETSIDALAATLYPGVPAAFETTGVGDSGPEVTSITFGGVSCSFSQSLGDGTLTPRAWENGIAQPLDHSTPYPVVVSDGVSSAVANRLYGVPAGFEHRTIPGTISTAEDSLYKHELLAPGCDVYIPDLGGATIDNDGTIHDLPFGAYVGWLRGLDYVMHSFDIIATEEDAPPSGGGDWTGLLVAGRMKAFRMVVSSN